LTCADDAGEPSKEKKKKKRRKQQDHSGNDSGVLGDSKAATDSNAAAGKYCSYIIQHLRQML
jgi:hypothetical protein